MINFLNNIEGQMVLNPDGGWGTGKSIFLKQLEYINQNHYEFSPTIVEKMPPNLIDNFKEKYEVFCYNAWKNDLYESPLESLVFQLLIKFSEVDQREYQVQENTSHFNSLLNSAGILGGNIVLKKYQVV